MKIKEVGNGIPYRIRFRRDVTVRESLQTYTWEKEQFRKVHFKKGYVIEHAQGECTWPIGADGNWVRGEIISNPSSKVVEIRHVLHVYDSKYHGYIWLNSNDVDILPADKGPSYINALRDGYDYKKMFGPYYSKPYLPSSEERIIGYA